MAKNDDSDLFREFIGDVEPLKQGVTQQNAQQKPPVADTTPGMIERRRAAQALDEKTGNYLAREEFITPVKPWDLLSFKRDGVQHGVFRHLKQGKYGIDATIDLHGRTVQQARQEVFQFLRDCIERNIRCAMVTHGKGQHRDPPALLKSCVNHWLKQMDEVLAFHSSSPSNGGSGSTYVLLRKSMAMADRNRDKYAAKRRDS